MQGQCEESRVVMDIVSQLGDQWKAVEDPEQCMETKVMMEPVNQVISRRL